MTQRTGHYLTGAALSSLAFLMMSLPASATTFSYVLGPLETSTPSSLATVTLTLGPLESGSFYNIGNSVGADIGTFGAAKKPIYLLGIGYGGPSVNGADAATDNLFNPHANPLSATFDDNGFAFAVGSPNATDIYQIFTNASGIQGCWNTGDCVAIKISGTPLPSTWLMLLGGLFGFAFLTYRGSKGFSVTFAPA